MVERNPHVSVVVVVYNMPREAPRTLYSLSSGYQRHIDADDYEVIVVDNGSKPPFDPKVLDGLSGNFRLIRVDDASPSPAGAVNRGLAEARGEIVGVMIDGARIATPGLLHFARHGVNMYRKAVVATLGWYLGYDFQGFSIQCGYDQAREDALLEGIDWPSDGYRLFEIGTMDESSVDGWFQSISESNALFMRRELWKSLGGVDERFDAPGGGLLNLDTFRRVIEQPELMPVILLGEATFHQLHGGISTNAPPYRQQGNLVMWAGQYSSIRGYPHERPTYTPSYIGTLPQPALARMVRAAIRPNSRNYESPLGANFDQELWLTTPRSRPVDEAIAALVELLKSEFRSGRFEAACAVARMVCERAPDEPTHRPLLSLLSAWLPREGPPEAHRADYHLAVAEAHRILGEDDAATSNYKAALTFNSDLAQAHIALSRLRMPGDDYLVWLERLYRTLAPEIAIEVGIYEGRSLALLRPPTVAIGIDPSPTLLHPLKTEVHIFVETSDSFFARNGAERLLAGRPLSVGFIDGLHLFEQALRDFINLEACCGPRSVILFHDTVPLDQPTQARIRKTQFHTGDVWKTVLCLKHYRPDLNIFTIATPPTGLTVVIGLDPSSRVLTDRYAEAVSQFIDMPMSTIESNPEIMLNIVPNNSSLVQSRLTQRQII